MFRTISFCSVHDNAYLNKKKKKTHLYTHKSFDFVNSKIFKRLEDSLEIDIVER